jgi:hypothetical protein
MRYPPKQQHPYILGIPHAPATPNPDTLVFDQEEMNMIVAEAKLGKAPVACHARTVVSTRSKLSGYTIDT